MQTSIKKLDLINACINPRYKTFDHSFSMHKQLLVAIFFFWIRGNPTSRKAYFVGPGERVKPRLSQVLTRGARPDSNSRPAVEILSPLSSRYVPWGHTCRYMYISKTQHQYKLINKQPKTL
jgi:hypothetical protein